MVATLCVSSVTAYAVATRRVRASRLVDALMMMPLTVSYIVLGLALILAYNRPPLALHGTIWLVIAGHLVISLPMSYRIVQAVMEGVDFSLLEAARSLGASEWIAVRRVIFPAVAPGLVASGLLAFVNSLQNYSMSLMVSPEGFKTLPLDLVGFIFAETGAYSNFNLAAAVSSGLAIYDTMQYIKPEISTLCIGQAGSMAAILLAAGSHGKRFSLPHSRILIHQPMGGFQGQATDIDIHAREILKMREQLNSLLAKHSGQPLEKIAEDTERDFFMAGEEAKEYGIVDQVISQRKPKEE